MLKKGFIIFICLFVVVIRPVWAEMDSSKEERLGERLAREVEKKYKVVEDKDKVSLVSGTGNELANVSARPHLHYHFKILDKKEANAFAIPGGYVYVTRGLLDFVQSRHELAGILAHEISHIVFKHGLKQAADNAKLNMYTILAATLAKEPDLVILGNLISITMLNQYSRKYERQADLGAIRLTKACGFNALGLFTYMERMYAKEASKYSVEPGIFQTHPKTQERLIYIKARLEEEGIEIKRRSTTDYLKLSTKVSRHNSLWASTIYLDEREILTLAWPDKEILDVRVAKIVEDLDRVLRAELEPSEIKVLERGKGAVLFIKDGEAFTITPGEASLLGETPMEILEDARDGIKKALWDLKVKFTFIGGFM